MVHLKSPRGEFNKIYLFEAQNIRAPDQILSPFCIFFESPPFFFGICVALTAL